MFKTSKFGKTLICSAALAAIVMSTTPATVFASTADWAPTASEKLVKMPATYLKRAVERDFASSALASALSENTDTMAAKKASLKDLQEAAEMAEGDLRIELQHQYLAEKKAYIRLMGERQDMQRKHAETRIKFYQRLLRKLERNNQGTTPETQALIQQQEEAKQRFSAMSDKVDMEVFGEPGAKRSKYSVDYAKNELALKQLAAAIEGHPMNQSAQMDGEPISKQDYIKRLIQDGESEVALLDQKDELLGYMAKLVALDAMALAEEVEEIQLGGLAESLEEDQSPFDPADNVDLFLN
ncbi:hypothetical protein [Curvivirga aplysinae]|uniref:hypothetical protein n=1 Tax=Curvivirga aplysinae TaxID=2529852 RepID=UPI0012BCBDC2|nr:hypothetical protein [Curvivirga aplysinae]MTI08616.1 hypothetical protein [Curvivirga aplysinae]